MAIRMARERTQLNINIDPELLLELKSEAIKDGKTLTQYITQKLKASPRIERESILEQRLLRIEENLDLNKTSTIQKKKIGVIFTDEGAKNYGEVAKAEFESHLKEKGVTVEEGLKELSVNLQKFPDALHVHPELALTIVLGSHDLTGKEMTAAYRTGSCPMRFALGEWCNEPLEKSENAFLDAVISENLT